VQAVGHILINVHELDVDMLSASAHKFNGPKGIGFLYIKKNTKIYPFIDGGSQEYGFRAGTENVASIVAMAVALKNNCDHINDNMDRIRAMEDRLLSGLNRLKVVYRRNGSENRIPGNISLSFKGYEGEMLLHRFDLMGICISTGSACDSINTKNSHVIQAIGVPEEYAKGTIRISLGKSNTEKDVDEILEAIRKITQT
jgi:cysteine desulfurase